MKVLVLGSGGREHALAWKIAQSPRVSMVHQHRDAHTALEFARREGIDLAVVQQDDHIAEGLVDQLVAAGIRTFGPTKAAARIEWSKSFAKGFMKTHHIPTARTFTDLGHAPLPVVVKADGLKRGKGVVIAHSTAEAEQAAKELGPDLVIEEFLEGEEISIHAFSDGVTAKLFPASRDHKRIGDGNAGPNTGGMGTIAPVAVPEGFMDEVLEKIVQPVIDGLRAAGAPYVGVLYPGLMLTKDGPKVLEYNARFGDPETESYVRLLKTDLVDIMDACIDGRLSETIIEWSEQSAITLMLASKGYPGEYERGKPISIPVLPDDVVVFRAGAKEVNGRLVTDGGRVLGVSAVGPTFRDARTKAYATAEKIQFEGKYYRNDIGV